MAKRASNSGSHARLQIMGAKELIANLQELEEKVRLREMRRVLKKAAKPIEDAWRANIPVRFGHYKRSLDTLIRDDRTQRGTAAAVIGPRKDYIGLAGFDGEAIGVRSSKTQNRRLRNLGIQIERPSRYAHLVEHGTKEHAIPMAGGKWVVKHPAVRGTKPMTRAFLATAGTAEAIMQTELRKVITRANRPRGRARGGRR